MYKGALLHKNSKTFPNEKTLYLFDILFIDSA